jgi:predicted transcriptional regulator
MAADTQRRRIAAGIAGASPASHLEHGQQIATQVRSLHSASAMADRRKPNRKALTVRLDAEVIARLKQIAKDAAGKPVYASVSGIVSAGILAECDRIEAILDAAYGAAAPQEASIGHAARTRIGVGRNRINNSKLPIGPDGCS